jgi:hypothetical protein
MTATTKTTESWPDLAIGLYDRLTGRGAEIAYQAENLEVLVPSGIGKDVSHAKWVLNGTVRIRTRDNAA